MITGTRISFADTPLFYFTETLNLNAIAQLVTGATMAAIGILAGYVVNFAG
jgi:hypothetical protein